MNTKPSFGETVRNIAVFFSIIAGFIVIANYFNSIVESKIENEEYISKLSQAMRPLIIFDDTNKIIYDHGALKYIDSIKVEMDSNKELKGISIFFKEFIPIPPVLECLGPNTYHFKPEQGPKFQWDFKPFSISILGSDGERIPESFRLEILK